MTAQSAAETTAQAADQCPACQLALVPLWREGTAQAGRCPQCGLIRSTSDSAVTFEEDYFGWTVSAPELAHVRIEHFRTLIQSLPVSLAAPVLDMGAGVGFFWHALPLELADSAVLVERSTYARQVLVEQTSARVFADPAALPTDAAGTFSTITLWDVLAHILEPVSLLQQLRRLLAADGHLIIKTPHHPVRLFRVASLFGPVKKGRSLLHIPSMTYHFTPENIWGLLTAAGFEMVSWQWTVEPPLHTVKHASRTKGALLRLGRRLAVKHHSFIAIVRSAQDDT